MSYNTANYTEQGGARTVIGGELDVVSGGSFKLAGVLVTPIASEFNILAGATVTTAELNKLDGAPFAVTMASTPASGSCAVQLTFKDAGGAAVTAPVSGIGYLSDSASGLTHTAAGTSIAALTNGALTELVSKGPQFHYTTTAAGLLGITVTSGAGTYYLAFILPNGKLAVTGAVVIN